MTETRTYPRGVPSRAGWSGADPASARQFYGGLFGWRFEPDGTATLDGQEVATVAEGPAGWITYIAVDDADASAAAVLAAGGTVLTPPHDEGADGRAVTCADPGGAVFRLWQAGGRAGAQLVNAPGSWNFSILRTPDPDLVLLFYVLVFGWERDPGLGMLRVPGYGDHLAGTVDPDIHRRQAFAPPGFADVVAGVEESAGPSHWHVKFTVADRDDSASTASRLGATVLSTVETEWTREALIRDPHGAEFSVSQFSPPSAG